MRNAVTCCVFLYLFSGFLHSQSKVPYPLTPKIPGFKNQNSWFMPDSVYNRGRIRGTLGIAIGGYSIAYTTLALAWYKNEEQAPFHFFNDFHEWKGIDKFGHALGGYQGSRLTMQLLKWGGWDKKKTVVRGGMAGFVSLIPLEILDGFAKKWGASSPDIIANFSGSALAVGNELLWNEQRIQMRASYHSSGYEKIRPDLFGDKYSRLLKDYNGHTLWLTARVNSFLPEGKFKKIYPDWLGVAVGYGANGMIGGYDDGLTPQIREREYSQYYLAFDFDLSQIKTRSPALKLAFGILNFIKLPSPTLEYNGKHGFFFHWLYM